MVIWWVETKKKEVVNRSQTLKNLEHENKNLGVGMSRSPSESLMHDYMGGGE